MEGLPGGFLQGLSTKKLDICPSNKELIVNILIITKTLSGPMACPVMDIFSCDHNPLKLAQPRFHVTDKDTISEGASSSLSKVTSQGGRSLFLSYTAVFGWKGSYLKNKFQGHKLTCI